MSEVKKEKKSTTKKKETIEETKKVTKKKVDKPKEEKVSKVKVTKKVKEEEVLLNKTDQTRCFSLCKAIKIIAKIIRVCAMIFVPFIALAMIFIPIVFNKIEINANVIKIEGANIVVRDDGISVKIGDRVELIDVDQASLNKIMDFINTHSAKSLILFLEISLLFLTILVIFDIYILLHVEKLFDNFKNGKTPFTIDNTNTILLIAKFMLASTIVSFLASLTSLFNIGFGINSIVELLIVFVLYYIFKYGTEVQNRNETKMYD